MFKLGTYWHVKLGGARFLFGLALDPNSIESPIPVAVVTRAIAALRCIAARVVAEWSESQH